MTKRVDFEYGMASLGPAVVAIGVFDGVHLGHQALVKETVRKARELGVLSVVATFDRDPDQVVTPDRAAPQLLSLADKIRFVSELGAGAVLVIPFCMRMATTPPDRFFDDVILQAVTPIEVIVGCDFRFGRSAEGDAKRLQSLGARHGFKVTPLELVESDGAPITSTRIRALVQKGDVRAAARLLGRDHRVRGTVHAGRGEGRRLGFPTANMLPLERAALPAEGVYAGRAITPRGTYPAGISVGTPPSFPDSYDVLETHLLDFDGELVGEEIVVEFVERLRDLELHNTSSGLSAAIAQDVARVRDIVKVEVSQDDRR